jgi:aldose sugar dehydrogenase
MRLARSIAVTVVIIAGALARPDAQSTGRAIPRPPAQQGPAGPEAGSAAADGYAPIPQWAGQTRAPHPARSERFTTETVATGLAGAFSFHFLPDGRIIVSERPGRIRIIGKDGKPSAPLTGLPAIYARGPQGLFEVLPDRDFAKNRTLYFDYTALPDGTDPAKAPRLAGVLLVARARLSDDSTRLEDVTTILNAEGIGGRMIQAADGTLLITSSIPAGIGIDSADWPQPQQLDSNMGKVLRINPDGSIPKDNPFLGRANARPEIYATGIRDDQGMAFHPGTGVLWVSEHGPRGGDEINAIEKGKNYGFPVIGYGHEYTGKPINGDRTTAPGMEQPVYFWTPDIAPAGIAFYSGKLIPGWRGNLFVAALAGKHLARLVLDRNRIVGEERLLLELDTRIRDVHEGPDGALYVMTDRDEGRILRLVPKR